MTVSLTLANWLSHIGRRLKRFGNSLAGSTIPVKRDIMVYFDHLEIIYAMLMLTIMIRRSSTSIGTNKRSINTAIMQSHIALSIYANTPVMGSFFTTTMRILIQPNMIDVNGASSQIQPNESSLSTLDKLRGT